MRAKQLDRKTKWALALLLALVLVIPVLAVRRHMAITDDSVPGANKDVRLVELGTDTMVLAPGSIERQLADWLRVEDRTTFDFELGDQTFAPGSAQLSKTGEDRLIRFSALMKKHPSLKVNILMPTEPAGPVVAQLHAQQAEQLRSEVIREGVDAARVAIEKREDARPGSKGSQLVILVSK